MKISELLKEYKGHSNFKFVDVDIDRDTKLFLDPRLIEMGKGKFCTEAFNKLNSFFDKLYNLYRNNASDEEKMRLFSHLHEINATKLGYGNGQNGKAKTPEGMLKTLRKLEKIINSGIYFSNPIDIPVFIQNFAEDCMSDMLTNILFRELNNFTVNIFENYGWESEKLDKDVYYWDLNENMWMKNEDKCILINGELILLVPKEIVSKKYIFSAENYFRNVIAKRIQSDNITYDENGKELKISIKEIMEDNKNKYGDYTTADICETIEHAEDLNKYYKINFEKYISKGNLSDEILDEVVYDETC